MDDRRYWTTDPEGLLAGAAQALEAKRVVATYLDCTWEEVDRLLPDAVLEVLRRMPSRGRLRRFEDRRLVSCVGRLLPEIPIDHSSRPEILRVLRSKLDAS